jgi:hypothetical protein
MGDDGCCQEIVGLAGKKTETDVMNNRMEGERYDLLFLQFLFNASSRHV